MRSVPSPRNLAAAAVFPAMLMSAYLVGLISHAGLSWEIQLCSPGASSLQSEEGSDFPLSLPDGFWLFPSRLGQVRHGP